MALEGKMEGPRIEKLVACERERVSQYLISSVTQILPIMVGVLSLFALHGIHCKKLSYTSRSVYKLSGYLKIKYSRNRIMKYRLKVFVRPCDFTSK